MPDVVLALSGGGAAGLGHIPVLQELDAMEVRPVAYAGASMGAIVATCAAAGLTGDAIRDHILALHADPVLPIWNFVKGVLRKGRATDLEEALKLTLPKGLPDRLEDLERPVHLVATDYHAREAKIFTEGPLIPVLAASAAIPGVFKPVELGGRWYVDGGVTNNLPVACLPKGVCVASDAARLPEEEPGEEAPGALEAMAGSMRIMMYGRMQDELGKREPDVLVQPEGGTWPALDFGSAEEIIEASQSVRSELREALKPLL